MKAAYPYYKGQKNLYKLVKGRYISSTEICSKNTPEVYSCYRLLRRAAIWEVQLTHRDLILLSCTSRKGKSRHITCMVLNNSKALISFAKAPAMLNGVAFNGSLSIQQTEKANRFCSKWLFQPLHKIKTYESNLFGVHLK